jgi:hypothetical protein
MLLETCRQFKCSVWREVSVSSEVGIVGGWVECGAHGGLSRQCNEGRWVGLNGAVPDLSPVEYTRGGCSCAALHCKYVSLLSCRVQVGAVQSHRHHAKWKGAFQPRSCVHFPVQHPPFGHVQLCCGREDSGCCFGDTHGMAELAALASFCLHSRADFARAGVGREAGSVPARLLDSRSSPLS